MRWDRKSAWTIAAVGGLLLLAALIAATGHFLARSAEQDLEKDPDISTETTGHVYVASDLLSDASLHTWPGTHVNASSRGVEPPRISDSRGSASIPEPEDILEEEAARAGQRESQSTATVVADTEETVVKALEETAEAVAEAAEARENEHRRAGEVLERAVDDLEDVARQAAAEGDVVRAIAAAESAAVISDAAEYSARIAAEAAAVEEIAEQVAESPEEHDTEEIKSLLQLGQTLLPR